MTENWQRAIGYAVVVVVAAVTYYVAQTSINSHKATLPVREYLDCLNKVANFDWGSFPDEKPSASEVCKDLTSRETVD